MTPVVLVAVALVTLVGLLLGAPVLAGTVPSTPTGVVGVQRTTTSITVQWTAPANNGGTRITGYGIRQSADGGATWSSAGSTGGSTTSLVASGLRSGRTYLFQVRATNRVGNSVWSAASAPVVAAKPSTAVTPTPTPAQSTTAPAPTQSTSSAAATPTQSTSSGAATPTQSTSTATSAPPTTTVTTQRIAVPSYIYPGSAWSKIIAGAPTVGMTIINPASGPGSAVDRNYVTQVADAHRAGITVLGYVDTSYAQRDMATVKADIDKHYAWYGVDGIFLDQTTTACAEPYTTYYATLYSYVHGKGGTVVLNPGTNTGECYLQTSDVLVTYEDAYASYGSWQPAGWEANYPASRFWHLVTGTSKYNTATAIGLAKARNAGWVYVTDDLLPNPWDTVPEYWSDEVALVKG